MSRKGSNIKGLFLAISMLCAGATVGAAPVDLKVKLDSASIVMGKTVNLRVDLLKPKEAKGDFPLLRIAMQKGWAGVCGDSVELRAPQKIDTVVSGNNMKLSFSVPVQSFDSGYYQLPPLAYVIGSDTVLSNSVALKVLPVQADAKDPINDYANVSKPENPSIFDFLPNWMVDYWWAILIFAALVGAGVWFWRKYRKNGYIIPPKPQPTPYEIAMQSLSNLKELKLWQQGMDKEYFTQLTDILRQYLFARFGINAMEMTSRQILAAMSRNNEISSLRAEMRQILNMADFVKFAKVRPLADDNVLAFENAMKIVESTKPVPAEAEPADQVAPTGSSASKQKKGGES